MQLVTSRERSGKVQAHLGDAGAETIQSKLPALPGGFFTLDDQPDALRLMQRDVSQRL
jgi:hypothetical protein